MADTIAGKCSEVLQHYHEHLMNHFILEEKILAACKNVSPQTDGLIDEIIQEHRTVEKLMGDLKKKADQVNILNELGHLLEKHIRKEERELFELLQEKMSDEKLKKIEMGFFNS